VKGLPENLYILCRDILLQCDQFSSYERLLGFCKGHEKLFWVTFKLKDASNLQELYELNLPILLQNEHEQYGWIFPIFLNALKMACQEGDALQGQLNDLSDKVKEHKIKSLPETKFEQRLFNVLLSIDFDEQEDLVTQALNLKSFYKKTAAFLVHGEERFGQETLVTRLCRLPQLRNGEQIKIKASIINDISILWNEIAKYFVGHNKYSELSPEQVIDLICERLRSKDLIFIIYDVNRTYIGFLPKLLEDFWQLIIDKIRQKNNTEKYLVMFLVDNQGHVHTSRVSLAWQLNQPEYPKIPLYLPPVSRFPKKKLQEWLRIVQDGDIVPEGLCVETLLVDSEGGIPERVYERICQHCNTSWGEKLKKCLIQI